MDDNCLLPIVAGKFIADNSRDVIIQPEGVTKVAQMILECLRGENPVIHRESWKTQVLNPKTEDEAAVAWVFVADLGNFSFWSEDKNHRYTVIWKGQSWTGTLSWWAAIDRAIQEGIPITNAEFLQNLTESQLTYILRSDSDTNIPLLQDRLQVLKEAGRVLLEKYDGSFANAIRRCGCSAQTLLRMMLRDFPSFRDTASYQGQNVAFLKRAQILIADVWACCGGKGYGEFDDIDSLSVFADYRIPQVLASFGALKYSDSFMMKMKNGHMFQSGDREEVEIRGCTIWAVELIVGEVKKLMKSDPCVAKDTVFNTILVDHYLWDYRRKHTRETDSIPIHRIRTIYY